VTSKCRACQGTTSDFAQDEVLGHVPVTYARCGTCGMVQAESPTWLGEAYSDAIAKLDIGLLDRCQILANVTAVVLRSERLRGGRFLDWAGGYGTLTRLMRDRGFDFSHTDPFAANIFAEGHEGPPVAGDLPLEAGTERRYDLITAFEVLEHLEDPAAALAPLAGRTDLLLTTTQVLPQPTPGPREWDYYTLETGQHITFYTPASLEALARRLGFDGVVTSSLVHLFHRGKVSPATRALVRRPGVAYGLGQLTAMTDRRHSLMMSDYKEVSRGLTGRSEPPSGP
jgi:hypothetical protein